MKKNSVIVKDGSTLFLRLVVLSMAALILGLCIFALPAGIISDITGMYRWILLFLYIPAVPFFYAIYQTMRLLHYIDNDIAFSKDSLVTLRRIKMCGAIIAALFTLAMPYIFYVADTDDAPGVVAVALVIIGASLAVAVFAAVLQRLLHSAMEIKTENELTV